LWLERNFISLTGITHPLTKIVALDIFLGIFKYRRPKIAHIQYFTPNLMVGKMTSTRFIVAGPEDIVEVILSNASTNMEIYPFVEEIAFYP